MSDWARLSAPIVVGLPPVPGRVADERVGPCALCGASVRIGPAVPGPAPRSLVCFVCFVVHAETGAVLELAASYGGA